MRVEGSGRQRTGGMGRSVATRSNFSRSAGRPDAGYRLDRTDLGRRAARRAYTGPPARQPVVRYSLNEQPTDPTETELTPAVSLVVVVAVVVVVVVDGEGDRLATGEKRARALS